ncbi:MAG: DUF1189 domain-containing protein [Coprococcus sp.]|nr:DUF1189 domain-containing protein [Coprococcus sp.]
MEEDYKKVTMADQIAIAVSSPKNYKQLTGLKTGKLVAFMFVITFLLVFIEFGISAITFIAKTGGFKNLALNKIPAFTYDGAKLEMDGNLELSIGEMIIYIDTEKEKLSLDDIEEDGAYIAMGRENIIMGIISGGQNYEYMNYALSLLFPVSFDNSKLAELAPSFYIYLVIVYIANMIGKAIKILLYALIFSIVGRAVAGNFQTGLSYGQVYKVCIYGLTLSMLLAAVNFAAGYFVPEALLMMINVFLSFMFINRGILSHIDMTKPPQDLF